MTRLQYKICTNPGDAAEGYTDVLVFVRYLVDDHEPTPWKCIASRRPYVDPIMSTHGRRLKALLRSLA